MKMEDHDELIAKINQFKELAKENLEKGGLSFDKAREIWALQDYIEDNIISALRDGYELTRKD